MTRFGLAAVVLAGCASGQSALFSDAPPGGDDAKVYLDGPGEVDAPPHIDAAIDAPPHIDAAPDARPDAAPDARPIDAAPMIDAPPDACVPVTTELLLNPAFDVTPAGTSWVEQPIDSSYPPITSDTSSTGNFVAQSGQYKAWLGGFVAGSGTVSDAVYQDVTVPAGTTQLVLTGYYNVGSDETTTSAVYDTAFLALAQTNGTVIATAVSLTNLGGTSDTWVPFSYTVPTNLSGQTVRVRMTSTNDFSNATSFLFDTLSLKATHCP